MERRQNMKDCKYDFPLEQPKGVYEFFIQYPEIRTAAAYKGDMDALILIVDFEKALQNVNFTLRQEEALYYVFMKGYNQREAGTQMGVTQQAVQRFLNVATSKVSDYYLQRKK